jgi:hypothetical protein
MNLDARGMRAYGGRAANSPSPDGGYLPPRAAGPGRKSQHVAIRMQTCSMPALRPTTFVTTLLLLSGGLGSAYAGESSATVPIDFSHCGYSGGGVALPAVPARILVTPSGQDDTTLLQAALNQVGSLQPGLDGFRGAVQLAPGVFKVGGQLRLNASGVVLRGSADVIHTTILMATGHDRRTLVELAGRDDRQRGPGRTVTDAVVPAGSRVLTLDSIEGLAEGARVEVLRPSTKEWIHQLGMDTFTGHFKEFRLDWAPGSRDLVWDRVITAVDPQRRIVTLDAPLSVALEARFGGGTVRAVTWPGRLQRAGIECLTLISEYDAANPRDEAHAWIAVALDQVEDAWVRRVTASHFACSAVWVGPDGRRVTIEDCRSEQPVSELGGYRRLSFFVNGQQVLVQRCTAEQGGDDFAVGFCAAGPNAFLDCTATAAIGDSGPFESWAAGTLYDQVRIDGAGLALANNSTRSQGAGWAAGNSVLWNCAAAHLEAESPPGAENRAVTDPVTLSLYRQQMTARLGTAALQALKPAEPGTSTAPPFTLAAPSSHPAVPTAAKPLSIVNGRFVIDGRILWGDVRATAWWKGQVAPALARNLGVSLTRFVPGRSGRGLTEDLGALASQLNESGAVAFQDWPGLWYDRRRDDHTLAARADAAVWAPFYEMPWARSGQGTANDGLSKYDLAKFNPWYFDRLAEFAARCDETGLVFFHNFYNTHNVLETGAHWVDFPWRPINCLNDTGLPEPAFDADGHSVHIANIFFDVSHSGRRELHRAYIFHGLDALKDHPNVVHGLGFQYAGPLAFQQFFLDTVAQWEKANGCTVRLALTTSKDTTDAILADPVRGPMISVIDLRYWQYLADGTLFAPNGGQNLAFRELSTQRFGKAGGDTAPPTTPAQIYRQVREYRDRYPDKAVVAWHGGCGPIPVLMAGGAQTIVSNPASGQTLATQRDDEAFNAFVRSQLGEDLPAMTPMDGLLTDGEHNWCLADGEKVWLIYSLAGEEIRVVRGIPVDACQGSWFDPRTGEIRAAELPTRAGAAVSAIRKPTGDAWLLMLRRQSG